MVIYHLLAIPQFRGDEDLSDSDEDSEEDSGEGGNAKGKAVLSDSDRCVFARACVRKLELSNLYQS